MTVGGDKALKIGGEARHIDACVSSSSPWVLRVNITSMHHNMQTNNELLYFPIYIQRVNKTQMVKAEAYEHKEEIPATPDQENIEDRSVVDTAAQMSLISEEWFASVEK